MLAGVEGLPAPRFRSPIFPSCAREMMGDASRGSARAPHPPPLAPPPPAAGLVQDYLAAMESRDLDTAQSLLADGFWMEFPGGVRMTGLDELIAWSAPRYRHIGKTFASFSEAFAKDETIVICHGTLHGEWPDGTAFEGVRFVDRFTIANGKITSQMVWNDLEAARPGL